MTRQILYGRPLADQLSVTLAEKIKHALPQGTRPPHLSVILIGELPASKTYVAAKLRACQAVGIESELLTFDANISKEALAQEIAKLNQSPKVDGILVQLPLPDHLDPLEVTSWILPSKDIDGLTPVNMGRLVLGDKGGFIPCTPKGIMRLLEHYQIETKGSRVVILGRSSIVGRPLSILMSHASWKGHATVTLAHSQTRDLKELCYEADILIAAIGKAKFVTREMTSSRSIVIDVGINRDESGKLCGDCDFESLQDHVQAITPVPGGVGPMTVAMLLENVTKAWLKQLGLS